jgi:transglutaminase-like putative cysteine protease
MIAFVRRFALALTRDKADTLLLLAATLMVLAPHFLHLPWWISALCCATLLYRASITFRGRRMPSTWLLLPAAIGAMGGVYASYGTVLGRDAGVAMLVLLVAFKTLEMRARRDLFVVVFLCLFLVLGNFFYSQSIGTAAMMVASVILLLTAQSTFQYTGQVPPLAARLRGAALLVALASPVALLLFVGFPRIHGPLWGMPGDATSGRTGLSETMTPGNLSRLAQSEAVAFRVRFLSVRPRQHQLYWRAIVFGRFDGRSWRPIVHDAPERSQLKVGGAMSNYELTLEPHDQRFLFTLDMPAALPVVPGHQVASSSEIELTTTVPVTERLRYGAVSYVNYELGVDSSRAQLLKWTALPPRGNPRAVELGRSLQSLPEPMARVRAVLEMFRKQEFIYTLEPPRLGLHSVDEFLFGTRAGFCEHFSSSFVFLMRAAGVPARVVGGYQGGELNPVDNFLIVRQSDAHAWAEVWLDGRGWVRVDPTAAVAPERVQRGIQGALPESPPFGIEGLGELLDTNRPGWLTTLRFHLSAINNGWNQWVLNYTPERQQGFLGNLADALANARTLAGLAAIMLLVYIAFLLKARKQLDPGERLYRLLCAHLARAGVERSPDEGPTALAARVRAIHMPPAQQQAAVDFLETYSAYRYAAARTGPAELAKMKECLDQFR